MASLKVYTYTCIKHNPGEPVRVIGDAEHDALAEFQQTVKHAFNCWVRGCQEVACQVRLVEVASSG